MGGDTGEILVGAAFFIIALLLKMLLDWGRVDDSNRSSIARDRFRQMYFAPDLILLAFGLLLSGSLFNALAAGENGGTAAGSVVDGFYILIMLYLIALLMAALLWMQTGPDKHFVIVPYERIVRLHDGTVCRRTSWKTLYVQALLTREGILTLVLGNFIGVLCVGAYVWYAIEVLKS